MNTKFTAKNCLGPSGSSCIQQASVAALAVLLLSLACGAEPRFEAVTIDPNIQIGYGLAIGDVEGDGDLDILLADKQDILWYENPSWKRHLLWTPAEGEARKTMRDNVCIAARDIDGDGKVEVAVGTNWNPGETVSEEKSGGVWYLGSWGQLAPVKLPHEPTTHRMGWAKVDNEEFALVVVPLHGRGNKGGEGENGSRILAYEPSENLDPNGWKQSLIHDAFHKTHNFDLFVSDSGPLDTVLLAGEEGAALATRWYGEWAAGKFAGVESGVGEIRVGATGPRGMIMSFATIEPMHGNRCAFYERDGLDWKQTVLDDTLAQGHGLVVADLWGIGRFQVVAGWRNPDSERKVGIRMYDRDASGKWITHLIDDNGMACEDLKASDLDGDGDLDLIASGRATKNVKIYWNRGR